MEHREPSRTAAEEPPGRVGNPAGPLRLEGPRSEPRWRRRFEIDRNRASMAAAVAIAGLVGLYAADRARSAARAWLARQPAYQLDFLEIELDPRPPSWYRGGARGFLEDVRRASRMRERIPLLDLKPNELEAAFKQYPWIEAVRRTTNRPLGVMIHLDYRKPVAIVKTSDGKRYLIDRSAIILPPENVDVDLDRFARDECLIPIQGPGLTPPWNPRAGLPWRSVPGMADLSQEKERIQSAARLAGFLQQKRQTLGKGNLPALDFIINPMDERGLFLWNAESTYILWGEAPGEESTGSLKAEEKWGKLLEWSRTEGQRIVPASDFWEITAVGVIHKIFRTWADESSRVGLGKQDQSAVRAKTSGQRRDSMSH